MSNLMRPGRDDWIRQARAWRASPPGADRAVASRVLLGHLRRLRTPAPPELLSALDADPPPAAAIRFIDEARARIEAMAAQLEGDDDLLAMEFEATVAFTATIDALVLAREMDEPDVRSAGRALFNAATGALPSLAAAAPAARAAVAAYRPGTDPPRLFAAAVARVPEEVRRAAGEMLNISRDNPATPAGA